MRLKAGALEVVGVIALGAMATLALVRHEPLPKSFTVERALPLKTPATRPLAKSSTTKPDAGASLPPQYAFLQTRNPFAKGGSTNHAAGGPEAGLVFHGVAQTGDSFTAFVEDMAAKHVMQLSAGDAVGRGKIVAIDIDSIQYEVSGKTKRIEVGQNLNGEAAPAPQPASPPTPPTPPAGADQPPPQGPPNGPPNGGRHRGGPVIVQQSG